MPAKFDHWLSSACILKLHTDWGLEGALITYPPFLNIKACRIDFKAFFDDGFNQYGLSAAFQGKAAIRILQAIVPLTPLSSRGKWSQATDS